MHTLADKVGGRKRLIGGPFGSKLGQSDYVDTGIPVLRGTNMESFGRWIGGKFVFVSERKASEELTTNLAYPGDIVVTQRGTLGQVSIVPDNLPCSRYVISQSQMAISVDRSIADNMFVYYYLKSPDFMQYIENTAIKVGVPHINLGLLRDAPVAWPERDAQRAISSVLSALDDKIELNRRMNETLEGMAQAIFKDWFVDFGPTRRKLAGMTDPVAIMGGLTPDAARATELAALFPDALGDDGLPVGWSNQQIGSLIEAFGGSTPSTSDTSLWAPAEHWWATPKDLSSMSDLALFSTERRISSAGLARITSGALPVGTVLLSSRAPIGYLAIAQVPVAINQGFIALKPNDVFGSAYLYLWCKANMDQIVANANGSTFQEISKKNFRPITTPLPLNGDLVKAFGAICHPLLDRIVLAANENRTLAETRDYLLPKLMSGEVHVRDVEERKEDAA